MISKIPTPNALVDASLWPIVKVTLTQSPSDDEYRIALGKLRLLRARGSAHFIVVDAAEVNEIPDRLTRERVVGFVQELPEIEVGKPVGVAVVATSELSVLATKAIARACGAVGADVLVKTTGAAFARAKLVLGSQAPSIFR